MESTGGKKKVVENIRTKQDHIRFLEDYISEITKRIDELTEGRDFEKEIMSLEYRIEVLSKANGRFDDRLNQLKQELKELKDKYAKIEPVVEELVEERAYYREVQTEL